MHVSFYKGKTRSNYALCVLCMCNVAMQSAHWAEQRELSLCLMSNILHSGRWMIVYCKKKEKKRKKKRKAFVIRLSCSSFILFGHWSYSMAKIWTVMRLRQWQITFGKRVNLHCTVVQRKLDSLESIWRFWQDCTFRSYPVSYTHLTLPTMPDV